MDYFLIAHQGIAEDMILWHRYNYYVLGQNLISDREYDQLEQSVRLQWSVSLVTHGGVGSDQVENYPCYIREGRRPDWVEREERDRAITQRWINNL